jgi:hypothetical protein
MLLASATALRLVAEGQIIPRGQLGSALRPGPDQYVYDGDRPRRASGGVVRGDAQGGAGDRGGVRRRRHRPALLALSTRRCRMRDRFEETRAYLFGAGVPAAFLPTAAELGRTDLA